MLKTISYLLIFLYSLAIFKAMTPFLSYSINKAYIIKAYCINKAKPELKCDGKCYLKKQIETENTQSTTPSQKVNNELSISNHLLEQINKLATFEKIVECNQIPYERSYAFVLLEISSPPPQYIS